MALCLMIGAVSGTADCELDADVMLRNYSHDGVHTRLARPARINVTWYLDRLVSVSEADHVVTIGMHVAVQWNDPGLEGIFEGAGCEQLVLGSRDKAADVLYRPGSLNILRIEFIAKENIIIVRAGLHMYGNTRDFERSFREDAHILLRANASGIVTGWVSQNVDFYCPMDFSIYPMDRHRCRVGIGSSSITSGNMVFNSTIELGRSPEAGIAQQFFIMPSDPDSWIQPGHVLHSAYLNAYAVVRT